PHQLLNKKKPVTFTEEPNEDTLAIWLASSAIAKHLVADSVGIVNAERLREELQKAGRDKDVPVRSLLLTLKLESWLRHLVAQGVLARPTNPKSPRQSTFFGSERQAPVRPKSSVS